MGNQNLKERRIGGLADEHAFIKPFGLSRARCVLPSLGR